MTEPIIWLAEYQARPDRLRQGNRQLGRKQQQQQHVGEQPFLEYFMGVSSAACTGRDANTVPLLRFVRAGERGIAGLA